MTRKLLLALALIPTLSMALAIPQSSKLDARIKTATYSADNVFSIRAQRGRAVLVQLEQDERLTGDSAALGMGDAKAWNLAVKGNNIIFKPSDKSPATNMIVTTNKRTYVFALSLANRRHPPTYVLRFRYPDTQLKQLALANAKYSKALKMMQKIKLHSAVALNKNYWGQGAKELSPTAAFDNGRFTYLSFDNGKDLPSVYKVLADGSEALVNSHIEDDTLVIHETAAKFVLRLGNSVLGIQNRGFDTQGRFNRTGSDDDNSVRILRSDK